MSRSTTYRALAAAVTVSFVAAVSMPAWLAAPVHAQDQGDAAGPGRPGNGPDRQGGGQRGNRGGRFGGQGGPGGGGPGGWGQGGGPGGGPGGGGPGRFRGMGGMGGMGDLVQPDFLRRDVPIFVDGLTLRENQRAILEVLFRDYEDAFQAGVEPVNTLMQDAGPRIFRSFMSPETRDAFRSAMEGAQEEIQAMRDQQGDVDPATIEELMSKRMQAAMEETQRIRRESGQEAEAQAALSEMSEGMEKWRAEKAALREAFLSGIKLLLDDEQQQAWPAFERKLVREKALPRGRISGESVDLFRILDQVGVPVDGTPELAALMENYEIRLVEALNARDAYIAQTEPKLMKAMQSMDMAGGLKIVEKQTEMRVRVRDVNEEFRVAIAASLPEEQGAPFKTAALESSFDRIFRTTSAQRAFEQAKAIEGLLPETLEAVIALENAYVAELASLTERLIATTKKEEPKELVRQAERIAGFMSGTFQQRGQDPIRAAMREQRDLSDTYLERLASLLSPEQYQGLSAATQRRGFGGGFENLPEDMRNRILERVDTNGNGQIDPDEEEQARQMFRRGGRGGRGGNGGDTVDGGGPPV